MPNNPFPKIASKVLIAAGERLKTIAGETDAWEVLGVVVNFITQADIQRQQKAMEESRVSSMSPKLREWEQNLMSEISLETAGMMK